MKSHKTLRDISKSGTSGPTTRQSHPVVFALVKYHAALSNKK